MPKSKTSAFVRTLQRQAKLTATLNATSLLPNSLSPVTAFIGNYSWQTLLMASFLAAWIALLAHFKFFFTLVRSIV